MPLLRYLLGDGRVNEIRLKTRKLIAVFRKHHPDVDADRWYLAQTQREKGHEQLKNCYRIITIDLHKYTRKIGVYRCT